NAEVGKDQADDAENDTAGDDFMVADSEDEDEDSDTSDSASAIHVLVFPALFLDILCYSMKTLFCLISG
ncbi:hypothetical protein A2U01_0112379, partial [Trifolium medium]|nr:hypothetical protein [Trifolium medium]